MIKYDTHIHSDSSLDGRQTVDDACRVAIEKGLSGITISDHADICFFERENTIDRFNKCISAIKSAKEKYGDKLDILLGIEMAEYLTNIDGAERTLALADYDVILGSVHTVYFEDFPDSYSRIDFSTMPIERVYRFIDFYFDKILEMIYKTEFDILTHLTCPLRYIIGKYKRNVDIWIFEAKITKILTEIIDKGISLEINTSGYATEKHYFMPERDLLELYYNLGGRMISIGSDAHFSENIKVGFEEAEKMLTDIGFEGYYYFKNRKPVFVHFI